MATDPREIQLTEEQRQFLAARAEETGRPWHELLEELFAGLRQRSAADEDTRSDIRSLYDALQARGMVGAMKGPGDLSTNPQHMEGFGEPRDQADSH